MPKIINLADASTYTLGAAANIFLPSQVGPPHFNYSNMSNLLGDPTNLICTFGSKVNSFGVNGYRFIQTKNAVSLARYDYLKYFVSQPNGNDPADWGNHQPDTGESIFLQYSTDNITWTNLLETTPYPAGTAGWNPIVFKIPDSLKISPVWLKIYSIQTNPFDSTNNINNDGDNWAVSSLEGVIVNAQCPINFNDPASYTVGDSIQSQVILPSNINSANIGGNASPNRSMSQLGKRTDVKVGLFGHVLTDISTDTSINRTFTSTNSYTLRYYKGVSFYLNKGGGPWGDPPDSGEDFYLQYSTDNTNWITIATGSADSIPTDVWTKIEYTGFSDSIKNTPIYFRYTMNQWVGSYKNNDNWAFSSLEFIGGA